MSPIKSDRIEEITSLSAECKSYSSGQSSRSRSPSPSHIMTGKYAALMETNDKECECWYYFIRYEGNEKALEYLQEQLESIEWHMLDDSSTFDVDLEHFVSAQTAKEMTKLELNAYSFHRKFDGKLRKIHLGLHRKDKNEKKMDKVFDQLGYGQIEDYIDDEDLDSEDLVTNSEYESDSGSTEHSSVSGSPENTKKNSKRTESSKDSSRPNGIPPALLSCDRPNWAKAKGKKYKNH